MPIVGTTPEAIHLAEDRGAFVRGARRRRPGRAQARHRDVVRRRPADRRRHRLPGAGAAVVRARRSRHGDRLRRRAAGDLHARGHRGVGRPTRCWSTGSSTTRSRSTSTRSSTATELFLGGVMEHIEEAGIHSGDSACVLPPVTLGRDVVAKVREQTPGAGPRHRRARAAQRAVRARRPTCSTCSRRTRGPAAPRRSCPRRPGCRWPRPPRGSWSATTIAELRAEGLLPARRRRRPAAAHGGRHAGRGQGGGAAVQAVPHRRGPRRRPHARPGDALDRRGHGHRRELRHGVRQVADRGLRRAADQGRRLRLDGRPRQAER